ncbi:hypothetical protein FBBAL38_12800 [Flavobacteria bacterium BAL38]|uniref:membrane protein n=1 Tax=unclassified Flavobacterium TaxID=196869 RepID=UPI0000F38B7C|nr:MULTISPECIES: membrane protein [unclassified Flavobacterium]EAZ94664.1 hypothetical protein FBBAL38_12800 [Flavobacteria bacterium BAL38]MQP52398.1 hypothetical protein [Flavobacterium sp. LMO9]MQP62468.1 hypothetical protein [Flavobacterium sp. LMO6]
MNETEQGKQTAIVSYLTIIGSIIAIFMNQEENRSEFASFHIRQALGIFLTFFLLGYPIGYFDNWMVSASFWIFIFILWIYGFLTCLNNETKMVPFLGELFQKVFKSF